MTQKGLELIDDPLTVITSLKDIIPNHRYHINAPYLLTIKKGLYSTQAEDMVIENECLLAVQDFLAKQFGSPVETCPRVMYKNKKTIMEWDSVLTCKGMTFLLESKHKMTEVSIK